MEKLISLNLRLAVYCCGRQMPGWGLSLAQNSPLLDGLSLELIPGAVISDLELSIPPGVGSTLGGGCTALEFCAWN